MLEKLKSIFISTPFMNNLSNGLRNVKRLHDVIKSLTDFFRINTIDASVLSWTHTTI